MSTTKVSTFRMNSMASAFLNNTPTVAPLPVATMMDMGVANPRAQGHAIISTETAAIKACAMRGWGPTNAQMLKVTMDAPTTMGTK